eukprot:jgi/Undpi1/3056/HiC_scaffold_15.g06432.m1
MLDSPASPAPAMSPKDFLHKGSFHDAGRAATDSSDNNVDGAIIEEARVRQCLAEERMNRTMSLPECMCLRLPRVVSYAEVGDPGGYPAFFLLGMDSHRYMSLLLDKAAKARGVRLICLDRPGRGHSSDFEDRRANRILEFPEILRRFCRAARIRFFSLVGQSLGASYALRCAQEMPDMVATTVYLISPWVPLSVPGSSRALNVVERMPQWLIKAAMTMGTAMPRLLAATGGLGLMAKGCSEEEGLQFASNTASEVLRAVGRANESTGGVVLDALVALEKTQSMGFDYRDVSMPVHVFHGRADHMVPFAAVQWMAEEMPACTLSVKMGGTHALLMDAGVLDCVLELMCEDFKHFEEHAADRSDREAADGRGPAFSFPAHTQHFQAYGHLSCREGLLIKAWEDRYFVLEGFQLYEFDEPSSSTARRVVDLRGTVAHVHTDSAETHSADPMHRLFPFKLVDAKHRVLYDLGARTTGDRAFWVETLTKASRFSMGSGEEQRQGALSKRFLVTTRAGSRGGVPDGLGGGVGGGVLGERGEGIGPSARRGSIAPTLRSPHAKRTPTSPVPQASKLMEAAGTAGGTANDAPINGAPSRRASTSRDAVSRRGSISRDSPSRHVFKSRGADASSSPPSQGKIREGGKTRSRENGRVRPAAAAAATETVPSWLDPQSPGSLPRWQSVPSVRR